MRAKRRTQLTMLRLTLKEKERFKQLADELELPTSEIMRLSMRAGLTKIRRQLSEKEA